MITDDDMRVQLALIKLGVVTDANLNKAIEYELWRNSYIIWRNTFTNSTPELTLTTAGEAFLNN